MLIEYRFYYEGLSEEEKDKLNAVVNQYIEIPQQSKDYISGFFDESIQPHILEPQLPKNTKYEILRGKYLTREDPNS